MTAATHALATDNTSEITIGGQVGIGIAVSAMWAIKNMLRVDKQGWFNNFSGVY